MLIRRLINETIKILKKLLSMQKLISIFLILLLLPFLIRCSSVKEKQTQYENQIGDTRFNSDLDNPNFRFCDSSNVLHKRAFVRYKAGGIIAVYNDIKRGYQFKPSFKEYSGYFIIRFAVNCNDESGRFRIQTLDSRFNLSNPPKELENHILSIVKKMKGWIHPIYDNKDYDGYKFLTIKIVNGQIK
jgi:hypothetical protein